MHLWTDKKGTAGDGGGEVGGDVARRQTNVRWLAGLGGGALSHMWTLSGHPCGHFLQLHPHNDPLEGFFFLEI